MIRDKQVHNKQKGRKRTGQRSQCPAGSAISRGIRLRRIHPHKLPGSKYADHGIDNLFQNLRYRCGHHFPMALKITAEYAKQRYNKRRRCQNAQRLINPRPVIQLLQDASTKIQDIHHHKPRNQCVYKRICKHPAHILVLCFRQPRGNHL